MKSIKTAVFKTGEVFASVALRMGVSSADSACVVWFHQPKLPKGIEKFKKN